MTMRIWIAVAAAMALTACGPKVAGPEAVVEALYAPYIGAGGAAPSALESDAFTADFKAVLNKAGAYGELLDEPIINFDPIAGGQDVDIKAVTVKTVSPPQDGAAVVSARFDNLGATKDIAFAMRLVDGVWRIDDIGSGEESVRATVAQNLKPAGDVTAMEAPVRAVYAKYAAATVPVAPLYRWAPLTAALRDRLKAADAMGARSGAPLLDFDPVVDNKSHDLGPIAYEAASGSVIARFDNAGEPKIIIYALVAENGAWKIADIHAPGSWDLSARLSEAGVP